MTRRVDVVFCQFRFDSLSHTVNALGRFNPTLVLSGKVSTTTSAGVSKNILENLTRPPLLSIVSHAGYLKVNTGSERIGVENDIKTHLPLRSPFLSLPKSRLYRLLPVMKNSSETLITTATITTVVSSAMKTTLALVAVVFVSSTWADVNTNGTEWIPITNRTSCALDCAVVADESRFDLKAANFVQPQPSTLRDLIRPSLSDELMQNEMEQLRLSMLTAYPTYSDRQLRKQIQAMNRLSRYQYLMSAAPNGLFSRWSKIYRHPKPVSNLFNSVFYRSPKYPDMGYDEGKFLARFRLGRTPPLMPVEQPKAWPMANNLPLIETYENSGESYVTPPGDSPAYTQPLYNDELYDYEPEPRPKLKLVPSLFLVPQRTTAGSLDDGLYRGESNLLMESKPRHQQLSSSIPVRASYEVAAPESARPLPQRRPQKVYYSRPVNSYSAPYDEPYELQPQPGPQQGQPNQWDQSEQPDSTSLPKLLDYHTGNDQPEVGNSSEWLEETEPSTSSSPTPWKRTNGRKRKYGQRVRGSEKSSRKKLDSDDF